MTGQPQDLRKLRVNGAMLILKKNFIWHSGHKNNTHAKGKPKDSYEKY